MKINIKIMSWINRVLMIPFIICLLVSLLEYNFLFYSMYTAFVIGCVHVFSSLLTVFYIKKINYNIAKLLLLYILIVMLYFVSWFVLDHFKLNNRDEFVIILLFSVPILLSFFWTFIIESIKKEL